MLKSKLITDIVELFSEQVKNSTNIKSQIEFIIESDYQYTGSGVFIGFRNEEGIEKFLCEKKDLVLEGVKITSPELEVEAECKLFFLNGAINYLEIWGESGEFPTKELSEYKLTQL